MNRAENNVLITSEGIKNSLKRYKPLQALGEYVWNGFDANATRIDIDIENNNASGIAQLSVTDNGSGIERSKLRFKFTPFFQSEKIYDPEIKHSATHGKNGVGRLTFFSFANFATWDTVYQKEETRFRYTIEISSSTLESYFPNDEEETANPAGTKVVFSDIFSPDLSEDTIMDFLSIEFCWFLELNKDRGYAIYINGVKLNYSHLITSSEDVTYQFDTSKIVHKVQYVCWSRKLAEFSKYYYIKSDGSELAKENTTLNNKGDKFYHSVYIQSELFDNFNCADIKLEQISLHGMYSKKSPIFEQLMHSVNSHLYDIRRPFIKASVSNAIEKLEIETAFPNFDPKNIVDKYKKDQIEALISAIYVAQPKLFTDSMNKEQKKTFIRLLDLIMDSGEVDSLFSILSEILDMNELERKDLSDILKFSAMSNITKTIRLIKDRYSAVADLKQLVYNESLAANEVNHLQKMIEHHYWLFGEQYNLVTAAEPNFEEALRRHLHYLHKEYDNVTIDHPDKLKQMDIFAVRQDISHNKYNNIVVELKHPKINLGEVQLNQVKKYMNVILSEDRFNADNMTWEFYLIGNSFSENKYIDYELENNKNHGEPHLVFAVGKYKIYVLKWSELFAEFDMRHSFLNEQLKLEQSKLQQNYSSADQIISAQQLNTATAPAEMPHS